MSRKYRFESKWRLLANDFGINVVSLCARAQLSPSIFDSSNAWLTRDELDRLWAALELESQDACIGLRIGQWLATDTFEPHVVAAYCSAHFEDAVRRVVDDSDVAMPAGLAIQETPHAIEVQVGSNNDAEGSLVNFQARIAALSSMLQLLRRASRVMNICPLQVQLGAEVPDLSPYCSFFGVEPGTGGPGPSTMSIALADTRRPFLTHKPLFWRFLAPALRAKLNSESDGKRTVEVVRNCLVELLPLGRTQIGDVATELGVGVRTLQRRLAVENESFQTILRSTREHLAKQYLQDGELAIDHIATLLGFETPNSLYRAFHKWTGMTPEVFRENNRQV